MKKLSAIVALFLVACAAPLPQVPPTGVSAEVAPPPIRVGESWHYVAHDGYTGLSKGNFDFRVTNVDDGMVTVAAQHDRATWTERYTRDWNWVERPMTNLQMFRFNPPYPALPFPLVAG